MIIQCPSCSTNFFLDKKKLKGSKKKLKCSRCSMVWTSSAEGNPLDVPSQGLRSSQAASQSVDQNLKPDHPLPVPFNTPKENQTSIFLWITFLLVFISFIIGWNNRAIVINQFPILAPVVEIFDPSLKFRGIEISNLLSRIDSRENGSSLVVTGSLINQENYLRKVPSLIVVIEDERGSILVKKVIKSKGSYFDYQEIKDFEVKFLKYPANASNIFVEIIN
jgi:predicted Zn finger-like uncharacterized protein